MTLLRVNETTPVYLTSAAFETIDEQDCLFGWPTLLRLQLKQPIAKTDCISVERDKLEIYDEMPWFAVCVQDVVREFNDTTPISFRTSRQSARFIRLDEGAEDSPVRFLNFTLVKERPVPTQTAKLLARMTAEIESNLSMYQQNLAAGGS